MKEFAQRNKEVAFVGVPKLYDEYTNHAVLVMEQIDGCSIDDKQWLLEQGYDLEEIGMKLVDHYIKQVMDDGFFHADPHPGNVKVRDGKIIWIDMGMMGRLTERDRELIGRAIEGIATSDVGQIQDVVMALGEFREKPDQSCLYDDISNLLSQYGTMDLGEIDVAEVMMSLMEVMKENKIIMTHGLTMLARGLTHMEGVLADIAPKINMVEIASRHIAGKLLEEKNWKKELKDGGKNLYRSIHKAVGIPQIFGVIFVVHMILELIRSAITQSPMTTFLTSLRRSLSNSCEACRSRLIFVCPFKYPCKMSLTREGIPTAL